MALIDIGETLNENMENDLDSSLSSILDGQKILDEEVSEASEDSKEEDCELFTDLQWGGLIFQVSEFVKHPDCCPTLYCPHKIRYWNLRRHFYQKVNMVNLNV